jgi:hypothetical protein
MAKGKPLKLTQIALEDLNVERDAVSAGLTGLERAGPIQVERRPGKRPTNQISTGRMPTSMSRVVPIWLKAYLLHGIGALNPDMSFAIAPVISSASCQPSSFTV